MINITIIITIIVIIIIVQPGEDWGVRAAAEGAPHAGGESVDAEQQLLYGDLTMIPPTIISEKQP